MNTRTIGIALLLCLTSALAYTIGGVPIDIPQVPTRSISAPTCEDYNPCTLDVFDYYRRTCVYTLVFAGTPCGEQLVCDGQGNCIRKAASTTSAPECGNRMVEAGEECDPPGSNRCEGRIKKTCSPSCWWEAVGCHAVCNAACTTDQDCPGGVCDSQTCNCLQPAECLEGQSCLTIEEGKAKGCTELFTGTGPILCRGTNSSLLSYCHTCTRVATSQRFVTCPSTCSCLTFKEAQAQFLAPCPGMTMEYSCGVSPDGVSMYCYKKTEQPPEPVIELPTPRAPCNDSGTNGSEECPTASAPQNHVPEQSKDSAETDELTRALDRVADLLERLINLIDSLFGRRTA